ncbi:hypothetical protein J6590_091482 [Homalodisca vitripennis]|nr:hypothetical protein J6590_091482 [Homalodisca vitripennis]
MPLNTRSQDIIVKRAHQKNYLHMLPSQDMKLVNDVAPYVNVFRNHNSANFYHATLPVYSLGRYRHNNAKLDNRSGVGLYNCAEAH